jgi:NDP-sugar pyrophosphorylase family protein
MEPLNKLTASIGSRPMVWYPLQHLRRAGIGRVIAVIGYERARVKEAIGGNSVDAWAIQEDQLGTGHAAIQAIPSIESEDTVVLLFGDCPFLDAEIIRRTIETHRDASADLTIATARLRDPRELGQVRRREDGTPDRVVDGRIEFGSISAGAEVFAGLSVWNAQTYRDTLSRLPFRKLPSGRKEQNLPDAVEMLVKLGKKVASYSDVNEYDAIAPNNAVEFDAAYSYLRTKVRTRLMAHGIEIQDPQTVIVDYEVEVGPETQIRRNVQLLGQTRVGKKCEIGPDTTLRDCVLGDRCVIGRGSWTNHTFRAGAKASDRLAGEQLYFAKPYFLIPEEPASCFVILPFHDPYVSILNNVIRPIVERHGFECHIADQTAPGVITNDIWEGINRAGLVLAEISEDNMNVWYELGLAHALSKKVILLRQISNKSRHLPFDVAHQRVLMYDPVKAELPGLLDKWVAEAQVSDSLSNPETIKSQQRTARAVRRTGRR